MNIEIFTICDYVQSFGSIINILGPFDTIKTEKLPIVKSFFVVLRLRYEPEEEKLKTLMFQILDPDKIEILKPVRDEIKIPAHPDKTVCVNHIIEFGNIQLKKNGEYLIMIETEGEKHELPFYVELIKK